MRLGIILGALLSVFSDTSALAATSVIEGVGIYRLRAYTGGAFANCSAGISKNVNTEGTVNLSCNKTTLVNFGCDGTGPHTKAEGNLLFQIAQMQFVLGKTMDITVTDSSQPGGTCTVTAIFTRSADF